MKKTIGIVKLIVVIILLSFIVIIGYQNRDYFTETQSLCIDLMFNKLCYTTPDIPNAVYFFSCFIIGFLVAYFLSLLDQFKANNAIKRLNDTIASHLKKISGLETEIETLKTASQKNSPVVEPPAKQPETVEAESEGPGGNGSDQPQFSEKK